MLLRRKEVKQILIELVPMRKDQIILAETSQSIRYILAVEEQYLNRKLANTQRAREILAKFWDGV